MKLLNVLSLFNGISCGRIALERVGIPVANYYESEIDKYANIVSKYNWTESVQIGDVRNVVVKELPFIPDLIIAGSPCQGFSFAGKQLNFNDPRSALFFEFVRILKECKALNPNVLFMLENVPMKKEFQRVINEQLGIYPVTINGALVSAQNRERLFWTNIRTKTVGLFGDVYTDIPQPADKGVLLADILESEVDEKYFLSEKALARIERNTYSQAKINPDKTGTINTKNNSGQLSIDSGTTLIGVVNDNGKLREVAQANCIDASYAKGMDNHGQSPLAVIIQRERGYNKGGVKAENGKTPTVSANRWEQNNHVKCVSMRGRHLDENGNRVDIKGANTVQRIEVAANPDKMNCVTSVAKDGLVQITGNGYAKHQQDRVNTGDKARSIPAQEGMQWTNTLIGSQIRRLTPTEVCRLFTVPDNYFHNKDGKRLVSESQQYKALGNGWIVDVIAHIFSFIKL